MKLVIKYAYNTSFEKGKFTIIFLMEIPDGTRDRAGEVSFTLGPAISLQDQRGNYTPNRNVYSDIEKQVYALTDRYENATIFGVSIRVYLFGGRAEKEVKIPSDEDVFSIILK